MQALATSRRFRNLAIIVPVLFLAACGQGSGPDSIVNEPATPLPPTEPGFCDSINFELACEDPAIVNFNGGATIIVDNPDASGINTSDRVARMQKFPDEVFGGTRLDLAEAIDFNEGESYLVKVWSPRPVTVTFKLEELGNPDGGLTIDEEYSGSESWEELCFDFTGQDVPPPVVALTIIFDDGTLGQADTDPDNWTFYYDDITQVASCEAAGGPGDIQPDAALYSGDTAPDLVIPADYAERTAFGSGSVIDLNYADDETYSPALSVFSGTGYGANVAQLGFIGFQEGFLTRYETIDFKVKGMPGFVIFVKLFDGVDALRLNLTSSSYASEIADGWFQVSIPVGRFASPEQATGIVFESDDSSQTQFRMLLNDVGFSGTGTYVPADPGIIPEVALYDRAGAPDLVIPDDYAEITVFGSEAVIEDDFMGDLDFSPALAVTTGFGYGVWNGQLAYTGFAEGFAAVYETLEFKAKGLDNDVVRVRFLDGGEYLDIVLTGSPFSTDLGNGWYQVSVPLTSFTGVDAATGLLFETGGGVSDSFTFLLTDIGFSGSRGPADSPDAIIPENVIFATDPTVPVDFEFGVDYTGFEAFGSGSVFNATFADDPDFNPVFAVTSGAGYGANVGQFAIVGFDAGFAAGFATLDFKVKGMPDNVIRVKFLDNGDYVDIDLTTSEYSTALGNGWYQVSIPLTQFTGVDTATALLFESTNTSPDQFTFLLTDFGFSGTAGGAGDHGPGTAGVFTETATESTIAVTSITNSIDFGGNNTVADPASTAIPAFEGDVVLSIDYQNTGSTYGGVILNFGGVDLSAYDTLNFTVDTSGIAGFANLTIQIEPPGAGAAGTNVLLASYTPVATSGNWATYAIPLADFPATDLSAAANLGFWNPTDGTGLAFGTLYVDDVYFSTAGGGGEPGGNIVVNGDFETGTFEGWEQFAGGGIQAIVADNPAAGTYAANLNVPVRGPGDGGIDNLIKNSNLEAGNLTGNESVTVSFNMRGTLSGAGGVVFAELFSELSGGGTSKAEILSGAPLTPSADWTPFSFNTTLGPDVSGGVTLQLKVGCGGVEGCGADIYFDDVSIVIN